MADYDILENWEGPTTENKDWRKKLDKGIREDLSEGMIEPPDSESIDILDSISGEDESWFDLSDFSEMLFGYGEPGLGTIGDVGRDYWNAGMDIASMLSYINPATGFTGGKAAKWIQDQKYKGELFEKPFKFNEYTFVDKQRKDAKAQIKELNGIIEQGFHYVEDPNNPGKHIKKNLGIEDISIINEGKASINEFLEMDDNDAVKFFRELDNKPGIDWLQGGETEGAVKDFLNTWITPSNVSADNRYKDIGNALRTTASIAPLSTVAGWGLAPNVMSKIPVLKHTSKLGLPNIVNKLPKGMQDVITQFLPAMSGKGTVWPKRSFHSRPSTGNPLTWGRPLQRDWTKFSQPSTFRNALIAGITNPAVLEQVKNRAPGLMSNAKASDFDPVFGDRDPVTFDPYIQERMERIREPQDEQRGPGPWNEFRG